VTKIKLQFVQAFTDRHGRKRFYFRRPGYKRVTLPGLPGSAAFMDAYQSALAGETAPARQIGAERTQPGSLSALIVAYYQSTDFVGLKDSTKTGYRNHLDRLRDEYGDRPVAMLKPAHVRAILDKRAATPGAANNLRKRLRSLMQFAVERNWIETNPVADIRKPRRAPTDGFIPWSEEDIAAYEAKWPSGTRERLALALLVHTGQRRSDAVLLGRQHVRDGKIRVKQVKTGGWVAIPLHSALKAELDHVEGDARLTFLQTQYGKPFSAAGFSAWFKASAQEAGLQNRTAHGLRKAAGRRLAEAGCTTKQIAAVLGHKTISEVERYTRDADSERLADEAMAALEKAQKAEG
jgi:integrase